jgi:ribA/ribD-fused uncharacterized protein
MEVVNMAIKFYFRKKDYGWLSNFERSSQVVDGLIYTTNEHYYQAQKPKDPKVSEWIRQAPSAWLAMEAGRSLRPKETVDNWQDIKFDVMLKGLRSKFKNERLRQLLLATGTDSIHEDSPTDMIWGIKGKDMLGFLLMQVRNEELRNKGNYEQVWDDNGNVCYIKKEKDKK